MTDEPIPSGKPPPLPPDTMPGDGATPGRAMPPGLPPLGSSAAVAVAKPVASPTEAKSPAKTPQHQDSFREFIETVVFVVVLVLILKTFLAEAFVIPTGSMATTLLGYHKEVTCEKCNYRFLVNTSKESDPAERDQQDIVVRGTCPNCLFPNDLVRHRHGGNPPGGNAPGGDAPEVPGGNP